MARKGAQIVRDSGLRREKVQEFGEEEQPAQRADVALFKHWGVIKDRPTEA